MVWPDVELRLWHGDCLNDPPHCLCIPASRGSVLSCILGKAFFVNFCLQNSVSVSRFPAGVPTAADLLLSEAYRGTGLEAAALQEGVAVCPGDHVHFVSLPGADLSRWWTWVQLLPSSYLVTWEGITPICRGFFFGQWRIQYYILKVQFSTSCQSIRNILLAFLAVLKLLLLDVWGVREAQMGMAGSVFSDETAYS